MPSGNRILLHAKKWLEIQFIGEAAVDDGGPRREYFHWGMQELSNNNSIFQGQVNRRVPTHNVQFLCNKEYQDVGRFFALSILQGGTPPRFLAPTIAHYLVFAWY